MSSVLARNEAAERDHAQGLDAALHGQFEEADSLFERARVVIWEDPSIATYDEVTAATVQGARLERDQAFTRIRATIANPVHEIFRAEHFGNDIALLEESARNTESYASGAFDAGGKQQRQEIISEHAVTLGTLGRAVVAKQVALGLLSEDKLADETITSQQYHFGIAYDLSRVGSNRYYRTSIAMQGARAERLNGRPKHMLPWLGRAASSALGAVFIDRGNAKASFRTIIKGTKPLRSREQALASARDWRTV